MKGRSKLVFAVLTKFVEEEGFNKLVKTDKKFVFAEPFVNFAYYGGAEVYPIMANATRDEIRNILSKVHAVVLPGGQSNVTKPNPDPVDAAKNPVIVSEITKVIKIIMEEAIALNDKGVYLPVFGICLGFEAMVAVAAGDISIIDRCEKCVDYNAELRYTEHARNSRLLAGLSQEVVEFMGKTKTTLNFHTYKVNTEKFKASPKVTDMYNIISYSPSSDESFECISMIEAKKYPFYAVQFHPELNIKFYYSTYKTASFNMSARMTREMINFFREEAMKNPSVFPKEDEPKLLETNHGELIRDPRYNILHFLWD